MIFSVIAKAETPRRVQEEPETEITDRFSGTLQGGFGGIIGNLDTPAFLFGGGVVFRGEKYRQTLSASSLLTTAETSHQQYGRELKISYRFRYFWFPQFSNFAGGGYLTANNFGTKIWDRW